MSPEQKEQEKLCSPQAEKPGLWGPGGGGGPGAGPQHAIKAIIKISWRSIWGVNVCWQACDVITMCTVRSKKGG